jgi:hypothetical protein
LAIPTPNVTADPTKSQPAPQRVAFTPLTSAVWSSALPRCLKRGVAGCLAAWASPDGTYLSPPTVKRLAEHHYPGKRRLSERMVQYQLRELERLGVLVVVAPAAGRRPRVYRFDVAALAVVGEKGATADGRKGATQGVVTVQRKGATDGPVRVQREERKGAISPGHIEKKERIERENTAADASVSPLALEGKTEMPLIVLTDVLTLWDTICMPAGAKPAPTEGLPGVLHHAIAAHPDLAWFEATFRRIAASRFLCGAKGFKADLMWVMKPAKLAKLEAGDYDDRGADRRPQMPGAVIGSRTVMNVDQTTAYLAEMRAHEAFCEGERQARAS